MKPLALLALASATLFTFSACGPKTKPRPPVAPTKTDEKVDRPGAAHLPPDGPAGNEEPGNTKPKDPIPAPPPAVEKPQYGIKIEGKPNQIRSPYDPQGRPIDVRGLPPGTEIECPFTQGKHLLVP